VQLSHLLPAHISGGVAAPAAVGAGAIADRDDDAANNAGIPAGDGQYAGPPRPRHGLRCAPIVVCSDQPPVHKKRHHVVAGSVNCNWSVILNNML
jgi:hypothetical protein